MDKCNTFYKVDIFLNLFKPNLFFFLNAFYSLFLDFYIIIFKWKVLTFSLLSFPYLIMFS